LVWSDPTHDATGYIEQRSTAGGPFVTIQTLSAVQTKATDLTEVAGVIYTYRVIAVNAAGQSAPSNEASCLHYVRVILPPSSSDLTAKAVSSREIDLHWVNNAGHILSIQVWRRTANTTNCVLLTSLSPTATFYADTHLPSNTAFFYRIVVVNTSHVSSTWSNRAVAWTLR